MAILRDRIRELRRVRASELRANPRNWRKHPPAQRKALEGVLSEIGLADALLARELPDGTLELIDGHLRAATTGDQVVPVLVLDVDEAEANKLLASLDPLSAMAETGRDELDSLLKQVDVENEALADMLDDLRRKSGLEADFVAPADDETPTVQESFHVIVDCTDEEQQRSLLSRFQS